MKRLNLTLISVFLSKMAYASVDTLNVATNVSGIAENKVTLTCDTMRLLLSYNDFTDQGWTASDWASVLSVCATILLPLITFCFTIILEKVKKNKEMKVDFLKIKIEKQSEVFEAISELMMNLNTPPQNVNEKLDQLSKITLTNYAYLEKKLFEYSTKCHKYLTEIYLYQNNEHRKELTETYAEFMKLHKSSVEEHI